MQKKTPRGLQYSALTSSLDLVQKTAMVPLHPCSLSGGSALQGAGLLWRATVTSSGKRMSQTGPFKEKDGKITGLIRMQEHVSYPYRDDYMMNYLKPIKGKLQR